MDAKGIIVRCLFFYGSVGVRSGSLLKCHAGFILFRQFEVGQAHVQVGVLAQCIFFLRDAGQQYGHLTIDTAMIAGQTIHVPGVATGGGTILFECLHGFMVFSHVVAGRSDDAIHLCRILVARVGGKIVLRHNLRFVVLFLYQIDFCDVIRNQRLVLVVVLQGEEAVQGLVVALLGVADVRQIVGTVCFIAWAGVLQRFEPDSCFFHFTCFQVAHSPAVCHVITFIVCQQG